MKLFILTSLCIMLFAGVKSSNGQTPEKIQIEVALSGDDPVGNQLGYAVKEKIRTSSGYLINIGTGVRLKLFLTTLDPSTKDQTPGFNTAYSAVLAFTAQNAVPAFPLKHAGLLPLGSDSAFVTYPILIDNWVGICGGNRVESVSADLIAEVDKDVELLKKNWDLYPFIKSLTSIPGTNLQH